MEMTGGQALMQQLKIEGVKDLFGIPGVQLDWATDALNEVQDDIRFYVPRHEQAASYMADGYARTTGREGVCMVVPGPGLLNALSGLATAYACSSPVLCITGQIASHLIGRGHGVLHELPDQTAHLAGLTKWHARARRPEEIPGLVHEAFRQMRSGRPMPVGLEVPPDVLQARADVELIPEPAQGERLAPPQVEIEQAAAMLAQARFPIIYAGGGVLASDAGAALRRLAEQLQIPVVMSDNGRGALPQDHPLALLNLGARAMLPHADLVLVAGSRFMDGIGRPVYTACHARYVYLNAESRDMQAPRAPGLMLQGDAAAGLTALAQATSGMAAGKRDSAAAVAAVAAVKAWCHEQVAHMTPQVDFLQVLRELIPDDGILVSELTQVGYAATFGYPVRQARSFITPGYQGTLGYGYPTALGAALGNPDKVVVSINGDGGFGWSLQELATAAKYQANLIGIVFVDGAFGNVRRIQQTLFGRDVGTVLHNPDYLKLADAFGVSATRVDGPEGLRAALQAAKAAGGPHLIAVDVGAMPSPWHLIHTFSRAPRPAPANPLGGELVSG